MESSDAVEHDAGLIFHGDLDKIETTIGTQELHIRGSKVGKKADGTYCDYYYVEGKQRTVGFVLDKPNIEMYEKHGFRVYKSMHAPTKCTLVILTKV